MFISKVRYNFLLNKINQLEKLNEEQNNINYTLAEQIGFLRFLHGYSTYPLSSYDVDLTASAKSIHEKILDGEINNV